MGVSRELALHQNTQLICVGLDDAEQAVVSRALAFIFDRFAHVSLSTGEAALSHAIASALSVAQLGHDVGTRVAALLEPLVVLSSEEEMLSLSHSFDVNVINLLQGLKRVDNLRPLIRQGMQVSSDHVGGESLRKMLLAMVEDIRVIVIRLSSRLQTLKFLTAHAIPEREMLARETLALYAPLANRLGIWQFKWALEDLSFRFLEPHLYKSIARLLDEKRVEREAFIEYVVKYLKEELRRVGVECEVHGRAKHIYSIYNKMQHKRLSFEQLFDIRALRVLVNDVRDCYLVLGVVHNLWLPIPKEFDDYILQPKDNLYQSLHTVVQYPEGGQIIEVQIRTFEMNQYAEFGLAAHWRYKERRMLDSDYDEKIALLRQLLLWQDDVAAQTESSLDWSAKTREIRLDDTIYVFTPTLRVIDLPRGATPLDFAYRIHTDLGHRCRGARVNGRLIALEHILETGDQVEVIVGKQGGPSRDWLNTDRQFLGTRQARAKVRTYFARQDLQTTQSTGRDILLKELARAGQSDIGYLQLAQQFGFDHVDPWLVAIGRGDIKPTHIRRVLKPVEDLPKTEQLVPFSKIRTSAAVQGQDILVVGLDRILTNLARCCKPAPGDEIGGFVTQGRGVSIHRLACRSYARMGFCHPERIMEATWAQTLVASTGGQYYEIDVCVRAKDDTIPLSEVLDTLSREKAQVIRLSSRVRLNSGEISMTISLNKNMSLSKVMHALQLLPVVDKVWRPI